MESTTHQQCEDERIESASQWTCLNGCWYPVYIVSCLSREEGGSGSAVGP